jgi:hypothetical protein
MHNLLCFNLMIVILLSSFQTLPEETEASEDFCANDIVASVYVVLTVETSSSCVSKNDALHGKRKSHARSSLTQ